MTLGSARPYVVNRMGMASVASDRAHATRFRALAYPDRLTARGARCTPRPGPNPLSADTRVTVTGRGGARAHHELRRVPDMGRGSAAVGTRRTCAVAQGARHWRRRRARTAGDRCDDSPAVP